MLLNIFKLLCRFASRAVFERIFARKCRRPALVSVVAEKQDVKSAAKGTAQSNQIEEKLAHFPEKISATIRCSRPAEWLLRQLPTACSGIYRIRKTGQHVCHTKNQLEQFSYAFLSGCSISNVAIFCSLLHALLYVMYVEL